MSDEQEVHWSEVEEGVELLAEGKPEQAAVELRRVAAESPTNEYAQFYLGTAYFERDDYQRALACYVRALELVPAYVGARVAAGQTLRLLGRHEQALRMGRAVLEQDKNDPDALHLCGMVCFQRAEYAAARAYLERFLETGPELEVALEVEGMLQILRGEATALEEEPG
ncbi:MAG: tetratricopeptide repeat protein [Deltaproteobacteria bacterium]|nr:tetratricopeptide repeat protein [Deltaproteobacteria bacterium]